MEYHTPITYHPGRVTTQPPHSQQILISLSEAGLSYYEAGQCLFTWTSCDTLDPYLPKGLLLFVKKNLGSRLFGRWGKCAACLMVIPAFLMVS